MFYVPKVFFFTSDSVKNCSIPYYFVLIPIKKIILSVLRKSFAFSAKSVI